MVYVNVRNGTYRCCIGVIIVCVCWGLGVDSVGVGWGGRVMMVRDLSGLEAGLILVCSPLLGLLFFVLFPCVGFVIVLFVLGCECTKIVRG
jgi:apolipoprotein N-acyltransferase